MAMMERAPLSPALRVSLGLGLGLVVGGVLATIGTRALPGVVGAAETVGALWTNAIRMTVLPLIVGSLIVGVAAAPAGVAASRLGWRALTVFVLLLGAAAVFAAVVAPPLLALLPIEPSSAASLRADAAARASETAEIARGLPTPADWLVALVPANPVKAAADSAMLPLIIFALAFGLALRSAGASREPTLLFFAGVADASLVLVGWVLALAPIGMFALAVPLATRMGVAAAGAVGMYVALVSSMVAAFTLLLYPAVALGARVAIGRFARACAPAQAVAFGSRSSLAALPAMMHSAETHLELPRPVAGFLLPLAVSVFKVALPI